ncbi:MAG TPA: hypothetical protein VH333_06115, partial [Pseudonocardiaceae bacterium]|nr:hypothetical protein [Pseudonocardiaceae bacterium]
MSPFFFQPATARVIAEIAGSKSLVLYVGAGVTITQSGHNWSKLVDVLLSRMGMDDAAQEAICRGYDPPKRASIVRAYFRSKYG